MTYSIKYIPDVYDDLAKIRGYFSQFYARTYDKFLNEYQSKLKSLTIFPEMHRNWPRNKHYRIFYIRYYAVLYTIDHDSKTVWIHRIINAKRKLSPNIELMEERAQYGVEYA